MNDHHKPPQARLTLLNVPGDLSPLKLPTWLKTQAADVQATASHADDLIIIRLFIAISQVAALSQRRLDKVLRGIVNGHPNIHQIDLRTVQRTLSYDEMMRASTEAQDDLNAMSQYANATAATGSKSPPH